LSFPLDFSASFAAKECPRLTLRGEKWRLTALAPARSCIQKERLEESVKADSLLFGQDFRERNHCLNSTKEAKLTSAQPI